MVTLCKRRGCGNLRVLKTMINRMSLGIHAGKRSRVNGCRLLHSKLRAGNRSHVHQRTRRRNRITPGHIHLHRHHRGNSNPLYNPRALRRSVVLDFLAAIRMSHITRLRRSRLRAVTTLRGGIDQSERIREKEHVLQIQKPFQGKAGCCKPLFLPRSFELRNTTQNGQTHLLGLPLALPPMAPSGVRRSPRPLVRIVGLRLNPHLFRI